ncbi:MAG: DMT family transporter [Anaerolineales bacterium]|jgi:drug/metabolite transporter (DMT)-like permease
MRLKADLLLVLVTLLWGTAFVVLRVAAGHGTVFFLNGTRFLLGGLLLLPLTKLKGVFNRKNIPYVGLAGVSLYGAAGFQQAGMAYTTASNAAFITSLSVVIVPFILWVFWRERPSLVLGIAVLMAILGGFLLSTAGTFRINPGDLLILVGSFFWALQVVVVGKSQGQMDALPFALGQYLVCGTLNLITGVFFERPSRADMVFVLPAILYTAVFSVAIGFTLQVVGQKHTPASDAALILSLEAVFTAFFGWLFLHEMLLPVQVVGCGIILSAVILVQIKHVKITQV